MAATFRVQVLSSEETVLDTEVVSLVAPGAQGFLGVLAHHAPLITALVPGPLRLRDAAGEEQVFAISGGFLEVSGNRAVILADALERPDDIDVSRAEAAEERARKRLTERAAGLDVERAEAALRRALNRQRVAATWG